MSVLSNKVALVAATNTDLVTVPAGKVGTVNVNVCNRTEAPIRVRIAIRQGALADSDYIEFDYKLPPNSTIERTGLALASGETIVVRADAAGASARVHGFIESVVE